MKQQADSSLTANAELWATQESSLHRPSHLNTKHHSGWLWQPLAMESEAGKNRLALSPSPSPSLSSSPPLFHWPSLISTVKIGSFGIKADSKPHQTK